MSDSEYEYNYTNRYIIQQIYEYNLELLSTSLKLMFEIMIRLQMDKSKIILDLKRNYTIEMTTVKFFFYGE